MAAVETAGPSTSLRYGPSTSGRDDDNSVAGSTTVPLRIDPGSVCRKSEYASA